MSFRAHTHTHTSKPAHVSACMHNLPLPLHVHILSTNRGILIDKCKAASSSDVIISYSVAANTKAFCDSVWPSLTCFLGSPLVSRKSSTLSSASHSVHQQQPNIAMCRDDAVRAAMMPAFPSLCLSPLQQPLALLCSTEHLCHCLMRSPSALSSYAHTVNSLSLWFSPTLLPPSFLALSPHKDLLARCCCRLKRWSLTEVKQALRDHREKGGY